MPQSLAKNLLHLIFSTKHRAAMLPAEPFEPLFAYAHGILQEQKCKLLTMNNVADHVHLLLDLHRTVPLSGVVMHLKKGTSRWLKTQATKFHDFDWQEGYGAFSIGESQRDDVVRYIAGQQEHHRRHTFQEEFRLFLDRYCVSFDERYVWQ